MNTLIVLERNCWTKGLRKKLFLFLLLFGSLNFLYAQDDRGYYLEGDVHGKGAHPELLRFNKKFEAWVRSKQNKTPSTPLKKESMINNFIMFSEDGFLMKDFKFHSVESCQKQILSSLSNSQAPANEDPWIYVTLESQVNKKELIAILEFLREQGINYEFGDEDKFIPAILKN